MISVRCPHCSVKLKVDEKKLPSGITSFNCPKCKQSVPLSALSLSKNDSIYSETVLIQPLKMRVGSLTVLADENTPEQHLQLYEGDIIIGRKSSGSSKASIEIHTADKSMSREHIRLQVKKDAKGGYKHSLSDNNSKNHTLYNNNYLGDGEVVVLNDNDEIIIGHTVLRFNV